MRKYAQGGNVKVGKRRSLLEVYAELRDINMERARILKDAGCNQASYSYLAAQARRFHRMVRQTAQGVANGHSVLQGRAPLAK